MASYAKKFVQYGVRIVGGCCGTTPQHIKAIRAAVKSVGVTILGPSPGAAPPRRPLPEGEGGASVPLESKSNLGRKLATKEFIKIVEMIPPIGHDFANAIEKAKYLQAQDVDAINVPDAPPSSARMSAISLAVLLEKSTEIESLAHYTCRDKNLLGMQSDLLGAYALGLRNLLLITGDPHQIGEHSDATAIYEVDSIGLTNMVSRLNGGVDVGGKSKSPEHARNEGILIAQEILERIHGMVHGVQIRGPFDRYETPVEVLSVMMKGATR